MHGLFSKLHLALSHGTEIFGKYLSWLTLIMTILMFTLVVLRYTLNFNLISLQESVIYLHAAVFLLGTGYTLKADGHVRVDILYRAMKEHQKAWVNLLGSLFLLLPMMIFIGVVSWDYIAFSWSILEKSQEAGGLPFVYLLKTLILGMVFSISIQGVAEILRCAALLERHYSKEAN